MIRITSLFLYYAIRLIRKTSSVIFRGADDFQRHQDNGPILTFWHRDLVLMMTFWILMPVHVVSTLSQRGKIIASVLRRLGHRVTLIPEGEPYLYASRISEVLERESWPVVIVADGPLGPAFRLKLTIQKFALKHRRLIVPLEIEVDSFGEFRKRWDKLRIPRICNRARIVIGDPISCFNHGQRVPFRAFRENLERSLNAFSKEKVYLN